MVPPPLLADATLDLGVIVMGLLGGLALFLYGMQKMSDGLRSAAGDGMKALLARLTGNRFSAALTGAVVTAVLQSSSITTVLAVGFVGAGLMSLTQTVGIIMGANVGTTVTAQILAFNITDYAWLMIAAGFLAWSMGRRDLPRNLGTMLLGLGMLFIGMGQMGEATAPLRSHPPFIDLMASMDRRLLAVLVGAAFTALVQSSSATIGIVVMLASQGHISLEAGIALGIGAKIGTCVTAVLAGLGKPAEAARVGVVHVLFNCLGAILWLPLIDLLAFLAAAISPAHPELTGLERLAAETPRQVANAMTLFALANLVAFIGAAGPIARLATWLVPERTVLKSPPVAPRYLDPTLLRTPSLALDRIRMELGHLGDRVEAMLERAPAAVTDGAEKDLHSIEAADDEVDELHAAILDYAARLARHELQSHETVELESQIEIASNLEAIGDLIETNLVAQGRQRLARGVTFSARHRDALDALHGAVSAALRDVLRALSEEDAELAREVVGRKEEIGRLESAATQVAAEELLSGDARPVERFRIKADIIGQVRRLYDHVRRIGKATVVHATAHENEHDTPGPAAES